MDISACFIVKNGDPYEKEARIHITKDQTVVGRTYDIYQPDISFSSLRVSRQHLLLKSNNGQFTITDMQSKLGTLLNGIGLVPGKPYVLKNGDIIVLASGEATLIFSSELDDAGLTCELSASQQLMILPQPIKHGIKIDCSRRQVIIDEKELNLQGKDLDLLLALYANRNRAMSYDEIRCCIWPERASGFDDGIPDVQNSEITTLAYRLRQKLGKYGEIITTVARFGYRLDLND